MFGVYGLCAAKLTNYLVDIIVVVVLVGFALVCARKGFIECFFNFISAAYDFKISLWLDSE